MRTNIIFLVIGVVCIISCTQKNEVVMPPNPPTPGGEFSAKVKPILDNNCVSCHGAQSPAGGLRLDSWDELIKGSNFGEAIIPFDSENSLLIEMLTKLVGGPHPVEQGASPLQSHEIDSLASWIDRGAKNDNDQVPYENSVDLVFVCAQDAGIVSVIDAQAKVVIRNVKMQDFGFLPGSKPHHVAVKPTPGGLNWYVSLIGGNKVLKFDSGYEKTGESPMITIPALLAIHPSQNLLYISRFLDLVNPPNVIFVLNSQTMQPAANTAQGEIPIFFDIPHAMAVARSGDYVYSASLSDNQLIVINADSNEVDEFILLGTSKGPLQLAVSPHDSTLYISCQISNQMLVVDVSNPAARAVVDSIAVSSQPWHPTFTPDGGRVYVGNFGADEVTVINTATRTVETTITGNGLSQPHGIAASNNSPYVYVSNRNVSGNYTPRYDFGDNANVGTVVVINTTSNTIEKVLEIEELGSGMAIWTTSRGD